MNNPYPDPKEPYEPTFPMPAINPVPAPAPAQTQAPAPAPTPAPAQAPAYQPTFPMPTQPIAAEPMGEEEWKFSFKRMAARIFPSIWGNIVDTLAILQPIGKNTDDVLGLGSVAPLPNVQRLARLINEITVFEPANLMIKGSRHLPEIPTPMLDAVLEYYQKNYNVFSASGREDFARFLEEDPAGFVTDVLALASLGGAGARSGTKAAANLAKASKKAMKKTATGTRKTRAMASARLDEVPMRFERYAEKTKRIADVLNKGFSISPDAPSPVKRAVYKLGRGPGKHLYNVSEDASGTRTFNVGLTEMLDPGALALGGAWRGGRAARNAITGGRTLSEVATAPFKKFIDDDFVKMAESHDVSLLASAKAAGNKRVANLESIALNQGNLAMIELLEESIDSIDAFAEKIAKDIGEIDDPVVAGQQAIEGFKEYTKQFSEAKNKLYAQAEAQAAETAKKSPDPEQPDADDSGGFRQHTRKIPAVVNRASETFKEITTEAADRLGEGNQKIPNDIQQIIDEIDSIQAGAAEGDFAKLKATRTFIGEQLDAKPPLPGVAAQKRWYRTAYRALSESMDDSIVAFDPALKESLEKADAYFAEGVNKINFAWGKRIQKAAGLPETRGMANLKGDGNSPGIIEGTDSPESLTRAIFNKNTETTQIPLIYELVGGFDSSAGRGLRGSFTRQLLESARTAAVPIASKKGSQISRDRAWRPTALTKTLNDYGDEKLTAFLGKETVSDLRDLSEILTAYDEFGRKAHGSQTAFLLDSIASGSGIGGVLQKIGYIVSAGGGGAVGGFGGAALMGTMGFLAAYGTPKLASRFISSKAGQNWLAYGWDQNSFVRMMERVGEMRHSAVWAKSGRLSTKTYQDAERAYWEGE